jgi:hypothetical protein
MRLRRKVGTGAPHDIITGAEAPHRRRGSCISHARIRPWLPICTSTSAPTCIAMASGLRQNVLRSNARAQDPSDESDEEWVNVVRRPLALRRSRA